jgi:hypothetical protein
MLPLIQFVMANFDFLNELYGEHVARRTSSNISRERVLEELAAEEAVVAAKMAALTARLEEIEILKKEQEIFDTDLENRELDWIAESSVDFRDDLESRLRGTVDLKAAKKAANKDKGADKRTLIASVEALLVQQVKALAKANSLSSAERHKVAISLCRGLRGTHPRNVLDKVNLNKVVTLSYK